MPRKRKETLVLEKEEVSEEPKISELDDKSENSFNEQSESEYEEDLLKKALDDENDSNEGDSNEGDSNEGDNNEDDSNEDDSNEDDSNEGNMPQMDPMMNMMNQMFGGMMPPPQSFMGGQQRQEEQEEETDLTDILSVFFHDSNDKNVVEVLGDIKTSIDKNSKCILKLTQVLQEHLSKK